VLLRVAVVLHDDAQVLQDPRAVLANRERRRGPEVAGVERAPDALLDRGDGVRAHAPVHSTAGPTTRRPGALKS
jgi:hypothetical protein